MASQEPKNTKAKRRFLAQWGASVAVFFSRVGFVRGWANRLWSVAESLRKFIEGLPGIEPITAVFPTLAAVAAAIPPLHILLTSLTTIWAAAIGVFLEKDQPIRTGIAVAAGALVVGLAIVGLLVPPLGIAMLVTAATVAWARDMIHYGMDVRNFFKSRSALGVWRAGSEAGDSILKDHEAHYTQVKTKLLRQSVFLGLGTLAMVGVFFTITPLAPVGLGILAASAVLGLTASGGFAIRDFWKQRQAKNLVESEDLGIKNGESPSKIARFLRWGKGKHQSVEAKAPGVDRGAEEKKTESEALSGLPDRQEKQFLSSTADSTSTEKKNEKHKSEDDVPPTSPGNHP